MSFSSSRFGHQYLKISDRLTNARFKLNFFNNTIYLIYVLRYCIFVKETFGKEPVDLSMTICSFFSFSKFSCTPLLVSLSNRISKEVHILFRRKWYLLPLTPYIRRSTQSYELLTKEHNRSIIYNSHDSRIYILLIIH